MRKQEVEAPKATELAEDAEDGELGELETGLDRWGGLHGVSQESRAMDGAFLDGTRLAANGGPLAPPGALAEHPSHGRQVGTEYSVVLLQRFKIMFCFIRTLITHEECAGTRPEDMASPTPESGGFASLKKCKYSKEDRHRPPSQVQCWAKETMERDTQCQIPLPLPRESVTALFAMTCHFLCAS